MVPSYGTHLQFPRISGFNFKYISKVSTVPYNTNQLEIGVLVQLASTYCSVLSFIQPKSSGKAYTYMALVPLYAVPQ